MKWMVCAIAVAAGLGLAGSAHALSTCVKTDAAITYCTDIRTGKKVRQYVMKARSSIFAPTPKAPKRSDVT